MKDRRLTRLIIATLTFMTICILGNAIFSYHAARKRAMEDAIENAGLNVQKAQQIIQNYLVEIETLGNHIATNEEIESFDVMHRRFEKYLDQNPLVQGFCIALESKEMSHIVERSPEDGHYMCVNFLDVNPDAYDQDWYAETKRQDTCRWGNVMRDAYGPLIICYCVPLHKDGEFVGTMTTSLRTDAFTDLLCEEIHPYEHSRLYITDRTGHFVVHPNHDYILTETLQSAMEKRRATSIDSYYTNEGDESTGYAMIQNPDGQKSMFYFAPIGKAEWKLGIESTEDDIYHDSYQLGNMLILAAIITVVLFILSSVFIYKRMVKVVKESSSIETELNTARNIQMAMVPKIFPPYPDRTEMDVHAMLHPAKAVGGDLYDFFLEGDHLLFCIGDVSGKGVPASLFMAITRSLFRNIGAHVQSPAEIAKTLNNAIQEGNEQNMFVTMFIGSCNLRTGEFACCNCGHNAPITNAIVTDLDTMTLQAGDKMHFMKHVPTNVPIGVIADFPYQEVKMHIAKGLQLFLYTDGVTEAEDRYQELYGDDRLLATIQRMPKESTAHDVILTVADSVTNFAKGREQSDDITMLCFQYLVDPKNQ